MIAKLSWLVVGGCPGEGEGLASLVGAEPDSPGWGGMRAFADQHSHTCA